MTQYADPQYVTIDRTRKPGKAILLDEQGVALHTFDGAMTNEQIMDALVFASRAHAEGIKTGSFFRAAEIRQALGLNDVGKGARGLDASERSDCHVISAFTPGVKTGI